MALSLKINLGMMDYTTNQHMGQRREEGRGGRREGEEGGGGGRGEEGGGGGRREGRREVVR